MKYLKMDVKVCECCGGLWIRNGREAGVYCRYCVVVLAEFPAPRAKRATGRRKRVPGGSLAGPATRMNGGAR
jgi:hypothetical protein